MTLVANQNIDLTPHHIPGRRWVFPFIAPKDRMPLKSPDVRHYMPDQVEHLIRTRAKRVRLCVDDLNISGKPWRHLGSFERDMEQKFGHTFLQVLDEAGEVLFELHGFPSDKRRPHDSGTLLHAIKSWAAHPESIQERRQYFQHYGTHAIGPEEGVPIPELSEGKREKLERIYRRPVDRAFLVANAKRGINLNPAGYVVPHEPVQTELKHQLAKLESQLPQVKGWRRWKKKGRIFLVRQGLRMGRTALRCFSPRRFTAEGDAVGGNSNNVTEEFMRAFGVYGILKPYLDEFCEQEGFTIPKATIPLMTTILARRASVSLFRTLQGFADRPVQSLATAGVAFMVFGNNPGAPQQVQVLHAQLASLGNPQNLPIFAQYVTGEIARHTVSIKTMPSVLFALWQMRKGGGANMSGPDTPTLDI